MLTNELPRAKPQDIFFLLPLDGGGFRWGWPQIFLPPHPCLPAGRLTLSRQGRGDLKGTLLSCLCYHFLI